MKLRWTVEDEKFGRELLSQAFEAPREVSNLEAFYDWMEARVFINMSVVRQLIGRAWEDGDLTRACRLYNAVVQNYSPFEGLLVHYLKPITVTLVLGLVTWWAL